MSLLDRLKNLRKGKEEEIPEPEPLPEEPVPEIPAEPLAAPQPEQPEPEPYVESQEIVQRSPYSMSSQQNVSQPVSNPDISQIKSFMEVVNAKLDMLKMQLEHLNQTLTVINAKMR